MGRNGSFLSKIGVFSRFSPSFSYCLLNEIEVLHSGVMVLVVFN
jgi:hypothetical protein